MSVFFISHPRETDLALFAGGELGPLARWRIERHIESCRDCEQIAAEFFRLPDQISDLGEVPDVDWKAMAASIEGRLRAEAATAPAPKRTIGPAVWQLGAAAACLIAVIAVVRQQPTYTPSEPVSSQAERSLPAEIKQEAQAPKLEAAEAVEKEAAMPTSTQPTRSLAIGEESAAQENRQTPDQTAELERTEAYRANSAAGFTDRDALADRREAQSNEDLASDVAAPPPPAPAGERAAPAVIAAQAPKKLAAPAESIAGADSEARLRSAPAAFAPRRAAQASQRGATVAGGLLASTLETANAVVPADETDKLDSLLRVLPPEGVDFEIVPGPDGKLSLRYFDPETGVLTIVDVDAP